MTVRPSNIGGARATAHQVQEAPSQPPANCGAGEVVLVVKRRARLTGFNSMPWPSTQGTPVRATTETKHFIQPADIIVQVNLIAMDTYCTPITNTASLFVGFVCS